MRFLLVFLYQRVLPTDFPYFSLVLLYVRHKVHHHYTNTQRSRYSEVYNAHILLIFYHLYFTLDSFCFCQFTQQRNMLQHKHTHLNLWLAELNATQQHSNTDLLTAVLLICYYISLKVAHAAIRSRRNFYWLFFIEKSLSIIIIIIIIILIT